VFIFFYSVNKITYISNGRAEMFVQIIIYAILHIKAMMFWPLGVWLLHFI